MPDQPFRPPPRPWQQHLRSGLIALLVVVGSLLNLTALILLLRNSQAWLTLGAPAWGQDQWLPLGAFLAGLLCYLLARQLD